MKLNEHREAAQRTENAFLCETDKQLNTRMGLIGEGGELIDLLKKITFHSHELNKHRLEEEIGDVMWYIGVSSSLVSLDEIYESCNVGQVTDEKDYKYLSILIDGELYSYIYNGGLSDKDILTVWLLSGIMPMFFLSPNESKEKVIGVFSVVKTLCLLYDLSIHEILEKNIQKLTERYPLGFSPEASIGRN